MLIFPVANAGHELDSKKIGHEEDRRVLTLCIGINCVGFNIGVVFFQEIQNVMAFQWATGRKLADQGDVGVG
jgi:hypothetical protein